MSSLVGNLIVIHLFFNGLSLPVGNLMVMCLFKAIHLLFSVSSLLFNFLVAGPLISSRWVVYLSIYLTHVQDTSVKVDRSGLFQETKGQTESN